MNKDKEDFFSEVTVIFRCMNCKKEHTIHRYLTRTLRLEFIKIVKQGVEEGWSYPRIIRNNSFGYLCSECKNIKKVMSRESIQNKYEQEKKKLKKKMEDKLEAIISPRKMNELTTEEIEDMAK